MLEARITKAVVVFDQKALKTVLLGVVEYYGEAVNFKVPYEWETLDKEWFLDELKEKLAIDFDLPKNKIDLQDRRLLGRMQEGAELYRGMIN